MKKFLHEFQAFVSRGNVLDLAVAVIIGAAFSAIVNSLVKDVINPLLGFLVGKPDFTGLFIVLSEPAGYTGPRTYEALTAAGATVFGYGAFRQFPAAGFRDLLAHHVRDEAAQAS